MSGRAGVKVVRKVAQSGPLCRNADAQLAREIGQIKKRDLRRRAEGHAAAFERDGFALDAFDALAHALAARTLPPPAVREFFIRAARRLNAIEDGGGKFALAGTRSPGKPIRDWRRTVLQAIGFKTDAKGASAELSRSSDARWKRHRIAAAVDRFIVGRSATREKLDFALDRIARDHGVSRATVFRLYRQRAAALA